MYSEIVVDGLCEFRLKDENCHRVSLDIEEQKLWWRHSGRSLYNLLTLLYFIIVASNAEQLEW